MVIITSSYEPLISLHVQTQCTWLVVPDTDSRVTRSKKIRLFKNCVQLQGFPIDSHTSAWVRRMIIFIMSQILEILPSLMHCSAIIKGKAYMHYSVSNLVMQSKYVTKYIQFLFGTATYGVLFSEQILLYIPFLCYLIRTCLIFCSLSCHLVIHICTW